MKRYADEAVVLSRRDFGESDRILSVYSKNHGKLSLIAKGIKKLKSRKRGHLEVFSLIKFSASESKGIDIMTEAEAISNFESIRKDLRKITVAYYFVEIINKINKEGEKNTALYELLVKFLGLLEETNALKRLRLEFAYKTLVLLGYWPEGKELDEADKELERAIERKLGSIRVGRKILQ